MIAVLLYRCPLKQTAAHVDIIRMPVVHHLHLGDQEAIMKNNETCDRQEPMKRISGRDGLCMDVRDGHDNDGNPIQLWTCGEQRNQQWTFHRDGTIRSLGKCMTISRNTPGKYVMIFDCFTAIQDNTKWVVSVYGTITNPRSGLVLTAPKAAKGTTLLVEKNAHDTRQGWTVGNEANEPVVTYIMGMNNMKCLEANSQYNALSLENCLLTGRRQMWALYSDGTIRVDTNHNLCVSAIGEFARANIIIVDCRGLSNQRWAFNNADLTIVNPYSQLVVDVSGSNVSVQQIILFPPSGNLSQKWVTHTNPFE